MQYETGSILTNIMISLWLKKYLINTKIIDSSFTKLQFETPDFIKLFKKYINDEKQRLTSDFKQQ